MLFYLLGGEVTGRGPAYVATAAIGLAFRVQHHRALSSSWSISTIMDTKPPMAGAQAKRP